MTDDIVTRLRQKYAGQLPICTEAADEIERLRTAGDALVEAIRNRILLERDIRAWEEARHG